ncbi:MAG: ATP-dependent helicase/nuclease subunit A, partial [Lysobacterales bacterium]
MFDDHNIRARVSSENASFIVQAPAGSGKTELLTQRFLNLLSNVDQPERVLAITFTRKATQEMRERIMLRLRQAAQSHQASQEHEKLAIDFACKVLESSAKHGWNLLDNPGRLQIHTIDGLCARISGRSPQAGTGITGLQVLEDARSLYLKAARRLIEDLGQEGSDSIFFAALSRVLIYLKVSAADLQDMLCSMLGRRDQWLSDLGARPEQMKILLAEQQFLELRLLRDSLGEVSLDQLSGAVEQMAAFSDDTQGAQCLLTALQDEKNNKSDPDFAVNATFQVLKMVATAANEPFAPSSVNKRVLPRADGNSSDQLDCVKQILADWKGSELASDAFHRFLSNPPLAPSDDAWRVLSDFQLLLKYASAELRVLFVEESKADFIYVAEMALQALGGELFPGDALLMEDGSLEHILLDEFQDTSHLQYELIRKLVSGWQADDGRSLFLVGDPMQSIYRFRKADVSLFTRVFENGFLGSVPLEPLHLSSNFRSAPEIIDWVNHYFPNVFAQPSYHTANFVAYTPVKAVRQDQGKVCAHPFNNDIGAEGEAELIA